MHKLIQEAITNLEVRLEQVKLLDDDVELVTRLMPDANIWLDYEVNVNWAVEDFTEVKEILAMFAKEGVMLKEFRKSDQSPVWRLGGLNAVVRLTPRWSKEEGAACRLVQTGIRKEEYPIYKLICEKVERRMYQND